MRIRFSILLPFAVSLLYSQNGIMPHDLSFGYGANHGGLGVKYVGNNVVIIGIGKFQDEILSQVGLQVPYLLVENQSKSMTSTSYMAFSYGGIGVQKESKYVYSNSSGSSYKEENKSILGWNIVSGYLSSFGDGKIFLDTAIGYAFGSAKFFEGTTYESKVDFNWVTFDIGLGIRL